MPRIRLLLLLLAATFFISSVLPTLLMTDNAVPTSTRSGTDDVDVEKQRLLASEADTDADSSRRPRGRSGCLNCRRRRKKCDERKPTCTRCRRFSERCDWDPGMTFRLSGIDSAHPSMRARTSSASTQNFHMVDVTFDSSTHRRIESRNQGGFCEPSNSRDNKSSIAAGTDNLIAPNTGASHLPSGYGPNLSAPNTTEVTTSLTPDLIHFEGSVYTGSRRRSVVSGADRSTIPSEATAHHINGGPLREGQHNSPRASVSSIGLHTQSTLPDLDGFTPVELEALDYLTSHATTYPPVHADDPLCWPTYNVNPTESPPFQPVIPESPDQFSMYYPNQEYRQLHATLYHHMVDTARGTGLTRQGTPELAHATSPPLVRNVHMAEGPSTSQSSTNMSKRREMELWNNYLYEIATWLDMFDNERHFQNTLPVLAQSSQHLRLSILALSARQLERRDPSKPYTESLRLYQEAIQMIVQDLHSMDTAVIASCVLLCVLEMMSSSPRDWARHLDGCAMLIKAANINGVVGGVRQAIFWCFARMDMWGGFLTDTHLKIPTSLWFLPSGSMSAAVNRFKTDFKSFDQYANYAVFLCASVLNVISNDEKASHSARWKTLFDLLEDWYSNRPPEMRAILCDSNDGNGCSFPIILYTNPPAISGNQLYHAASLLMLQAKPRDIKIRSHKSIFWHARQICGITASNPSHSAYTNAPQPLWIAGRVLSHPLEHRTVLDLLSHIERETGFATTWRAEDLKVHWGEFDHV